MTPSLSAPIIGLFIGRIEPRWEGKPPSAIGKRPVDGPLEIDANGFVDDAQADLTAHGGAEKAIHHYASDHMAHWRSQFPDRADDFVPGCFGENIATEGLTEDTLCLGDVLSLGTAVVQICQGRQPCWKLNAHLELSTLATQFQKTGRTGWYYRVLQPGHAAVGDHMTLQDRPHPDWSLARLIKARFDRALPQQDAAFLAAIPAISEAWRETFVKRS